MCTAVRAIVGLGVVSLITACGGGSDSTAAPDDSPLHLTSVTVAGTTSVPSTVQVNGVADGDGHADTAWTVTLAADGGHVPVYHDGSAFSSLITVTAPETAPVVASFTVTIDP